MAELVVYVDRSGVAPGKRVELKERLRELVAFVEAREPQLVAYGFFLDEQAEEMTVVAVHPDAASLELHLEVAGAEFRKLAPLLTLRSIDVYGSVPDRTVARLREKAAALGGGAPVTVHPRHAGFARGAVRDG